MLKLRGMETRITLGLIALSVALGGCARLSGNANETAEAPVTEEAAASTGTSQETAAPIPTSGARTADQFDTTTAEEKAAATATPDQAGARLGEVTASLGDPTDPGLWINTTLVNSAQPGRIENPATGKSGLVELRPLEGEGGASISLAAMRLLDIPLTDIPTITVYAQ